MPPLGVAVDGWSFPWATWVGFEYEEPSVLVSQRFEVGV